MNSVYLWLANLVMLVHLAYVSYIVLGQLLILVGAWRGWSWIRNGWFRYTHLAAISIVVLEAILGIACPLTVWEQQLRELAGRPQANEQFLPHLVHQVLFFELSPWIFTLIYISFGALVLATLYWIPPGDSDRHPQ